MNSSKGQASVEFVLMASVVIATIMFVTKEFRDNAYLAKYLDGPWQLLDGMAQHGVWATSATAMQKDPGLSPRRGTMSGEQEN